MKLLALAFSFACFTPLFCQGNGAPYNPDANMDSLINSVDVISLIQYFGLEFLPTEDDLDNTNEIQSFELSGDTLFLVPDGGFVVLSELGSLLNTDLPPDTLQHHVVDADGDSVGERMSWLECKGACQNSTQEGKTDWHVPTIDEIGLGFPGIELTMESVEADQNGNQVVWTDDRSWGESGGFRAYRYTKNTSSDEWFLGLDYTRYLHGCVCVRTEP